MPAITLAQAEIDLEINMRLNNPVLIIGAVGVGKTDLIKKVCRKFAAEFGQYGCIDKRASQMHATDVSCPMPDHTTGKIKNFVPDWLPDVARDGAQGALLFDELTDAQLGTQASLNQLFLERVLPGYKLPDGWCIVATGNRGMDRAAAQKISRAMANRLVIIEIKVDVAAWLAWGNANGIAPILLAYIQQANAISADVGVQTLHRYPTAGGSDAVAFVTPRSLARCSAYFSLPGLNDSTLKRNLAHNVGDDTADDIMNYLATYRLVPDLNAILQDPANASVPREPSVNFALTVAMISHVTHANLDKLNTYLKRIDPAYRAAFWSNLIAKDASFETTRPYIDHLIAQQQVS